ncbi:hypothetical protein Cob_v008570 [Colletotrichum orbiculare MAFF 240422]|uniref:Uncharacterized protein n=1 Tax=Colletotrichum orbiculare (strain 104-T / ATCC 96160 / CBS 514.97 / LARS 414 / MAFF 240422) TaxID=1213857 RepID=A0A484FJ72_COLOR|nr:hypothetical protein Cob_v008570 [Colletotrichum orbiculare MAFF 240422]
MACFIYINGFPGVGKETTAKSLSQLIPGSKVLGNHQLIDPIAKTMGRKNKEYYRQRARLRRLTLQVITESSDTEGIVYIFTDCRSADKISENIAREYEDAAKRQGVPFFPVLLTCQLEENLRRVVGTGRGEKWGNTKMTDTAELEKMRRNGSVFRFGGPVELELDVTHLSPEVAAWQILGHVALAMQKHEKL